MLKVSKDSPTQGGDYGPVVDRYEEVDGYRVGFTLCPAEAIRETEAVMTKNMQAMQST